MNVKQVGTAAVFALAGTAALAESPTIVEDNFVATKTRAEVRAEVVRAREAGVVFVSEVDLSSTRPAQADSTLSRAQVQAELRNGPRTRYGELTPAA